MNQTFQEIKRAVLTRVLFKNTLIRVSASGYLKISYIDENNQQKFILIESTRRPNQFQPIGGVYKFDENARKELKKIGFSPEDEEFDADKNNIKNDIRGIIRGKDFNKFLKWFQDRKSREGDPVLRQIKEKLSLFKIDLSDISFDLLQIKLTKRIFDGFNKSPDKTIPYLNFRIIDIFEFNYLNSNVDKLLEILQKAVSDNSHIKILSSDEIKKQKNLEIDKYYLSPHCSYLVGNKKLYPDGFPYPLDNHYKTVLENMINNMDVPFEPGYDVKEFVDTINGISSARNVQNQLFPAENDLRKLLGECFVLFIPKDMLSGDFYFVKKSGNSTYLVVGECFGEGISAALLTCIAITILTDIINSDKFAFEILESFAKRFGNVFMGYMGNVSEYKHNEIRDKIEIGICQIQGNTIHYCGTKGSLFYYYQNRIVHGLKSKNNMSIDLRNFDKKVKEEILKIENADIFYLLTDGYVKQYGGPYGNTFGEVRLKELLEESLFDNQLAAQKEILEQKMTNWINPQSQGQSSSYTIQDDITIIGFKANMVQE